jgi:hypothetical protein
MAEIDHVTEQVVHELIGLISAATGDDYSQVPRKDKWELAEGWILDWRSRHGGALDLLGIASEIVRRARVEGLEPVEQFRDTDGNDHLIIQLPGGERYEVILPNRLDLVAFTSALVTIRREEIARERRLRRAAERLGYALARSRKGIGIDNVGEFQIIDRDHNWIVAGEHFDMSLDAVDDWLAGKRDELR